MAELIRNLVMNMMPLMLFIGFLVIAYGIVSTGVTLLGKVIQFLDRKVQIMERALIDNNRK
jgi:hypothetical protein